MTRPLRVGVIGANPNRSWAKDSHIPALRSLENVQLAAVAPPAVRAPTPLLRRSASARPTTIPAP